MTKANILLGRFQPLTRGHIKCAMEGFRKNGIKTLLCIIYTPQEKKDLRHPFATEELMELYIETIKANSRYFHKEDIIFVKSAAFPIIFDEMEKRGYEPVGILCGTDRVKDYKRQASKYTTREGKYIDCIEIKRSDEDISATKAREALLNGDKETFYNIVEIPLSLKYKNSIFEKLQKIIKEI